jgi:hypothetical protein
MHQDVSQVTALLEEFKDRAVANRERSIRRNRQEMFRTSPVESEYLVCFMPINEGTSYRPFAPAFTSAKTRRPA